MVLRCMPHFMKNKEIIYNIKLRQAPEFLFV